MPIKEGFLDHIVRIHFGGGGGPVFLMRFGSGASYQLPPVTLSSSSITFYSGDICPASVSGFVSAPSGSANTVANLRPGHTVWRYPTSLSSNGVGGGDITALSAFPVKENFDFTASSVFAWAPHEIWNGFYTDPPTNSSKEMVVDEDWSVQIQCMLVRNLKDVAFHTATRDYKFTFTDGTVFDWNADIFSSVPKDYFIVRPMQLDGRYPNGVANHGVEPHIGEGATMQIPVAVTQTGFTADINGLSGGMGFLNSGPYYATLV